LFVITAIALIPLAKLIGDSTEHLSTHHGSTLGSLISVSFGNAAEIIIAVVAINAGLLELVKASITGSILGNIMLIFGLSVIAGGLWHKEQLFNKENAGLQSTLIFLALIGLAIPTIMSITILNADYEGQAKIQILSDSVAILLLFVYVVGIVFTFFTH
jgi:Ca2+:H+ antiporter